MNQPTTIRQVLVATDFSPQSRRAVDRAAQLAGKAGADLELVHALPADPLDEIRGWLGFERVKESLRSEAARELSALATAVRGQHALLARTELRSGRVLDEILAAADGCDADLLVVAARGASRLRRLALGTTAERLLRRTRRPMLVVRRPARDPYQRVLLPVDFSSWSDTALDLARAVAPAAHLVLLHAWQVPFEGKLRLAGLDDATIDTHRRRAEFEARSLLDTLAAAHGLGEREWTPALVHGEPWSAIAEAEQTHDIDLVVIGKHGRNVAEELLLGSVTKGVVSDSAADVLVATLA
jgi:nucleotide-binding universal stress UspA family protein